MGGKNSRELLDTEECKRNTYRQCIDAGCHGQSEHHLQAGRVILVLAIFVLEGFHYHASAQEGKDTECNPMVNTFYQVAEKTGAYPSQQRHQSLEKAEADGHHQHRAQPGAFQYNSAGYRNGETIHRKSYGQ